MRKCHKLSVNKRSETWSNVCFYDTETLPTALPGGGTLQQFRMGWGCYVNRDKGTEEWSFATKPEDLLQWMTEQCRPRTTLFLFAHNQYFDFKILGAHILLPQWGWDMTSVYFAESGIQSITEFRKGTCRLVFLDSMNYFSVSLKELGKKVGVEKQEVNPLTADEQTLIAYCKQDVNVVKSAMLALLDWVSSNDLGNMQKTCASLAFTSFRHRFMPHPIFIHDVKPALALEREGYHGGRVEVFYRGKAKEDFYQLDVNSMYPFIMQHYRLPHKLLSYWPHGMKYRELHAQVKKRYVVARVTLKTDKARYPYRLNNMLCHPVGEFTTVLCQESLLAAMTAKEIQAVHEVALYDTAPLFNDFVSYFWAARKKAQEEGRGTDAYFLKIMMNTLYGKFGQKRVQKLVKPGLDPTAFDSSLWVVDGLHCTRWRFAGKEVWILPGRCQTDFCALPKECDKKTCALAADCESGNSFPAISAAITDYARCYLWSLIVQAGERHVYYVDTDCLVVDQAGYDNLAHHIGPELGQLKLEKQFTDLEIFSPKDYRFGDKTKHKGVKSNAVYDPLTDTYRQDQWERLRGGLKREGREGILIRSIVKKLSRELKTRRPGPNGWTRPIMLEGSTHLGGV